MSKQQRKPGRFCFIRSPIAVERSLDPVAWAVFAEGSSPLLEAAIALQSSAVLGSPFGAGAAAGAAAVAPAGGGVAAAGCAVSVGAAGPCWLPEEHPRSTTRPVRGSACRSMAAPYQRAAWPGAPGRRGAPASSRRGGAVGLGEAGPVHGGAVAHLDGGAGE